MRGETRVGMAAAMNGGAPRRDGAGAPRVSSLMALMGVALAATGVVATWDAARESDAALSDFAQEQVTLARGLAAALSTSAVGPTDAAGSPFERVMAGLRASESQGKRRVLVRPPGGREFLDGEGNAVPLPTLRQAAATGSSIARVERDDATRLGLPRRLAFAGLAPVSLGPGTAPWTVGVVVSAERVRDRERRARLRLILSMAVATCLVLLFGGVAMRTLRKELTLRHHLALAQMRQEADDRLARANKAATLGTLAIGIAHEISTPLAVIAVRAEQLAARATDARAAHGAKVVLEQTDRIGHTIRGLLGLVRGDVPAARPVAPAEVVRGAVSLVEHRFDKAGVRLASDVPEALPEIAGDARLLEQALVNLMLNACDASARGDLVTVRAAARHEGLVLSVEDTGAGISGADAGRALEPFFTTKPRGEGSGLGLAITREIVASHRGDLTLSPRQPRGTEAAMRLPFAGAAQGASA